MLTYNKRSFTPYDKPPPWSWQTLTQAEYLQKKIGTEMDPMRCWEDEDENIISPEWMAIWHRYKGNMYNHVWMNVDTSIIWGDPPRAHIDPQTKAHTGKRISKRQWHEHMFSMIQCNADMTRMEMLHIAGVERK